MICFNDRAGQRTNNAASPLSPGSGVRGVVARSFVREVALRKLGNGEPFDGEGILAVTKALLQSGIGYVGGYQGSPVSQRLDIMVRGETI